MSNDLGIDRSGNNNSWTVTNLAYSDQMLDSPTNNFCTMNPLDKTNIGAVVYTEGNLVVDPTPTESGAPIKIFNNVYVSSGKWYWEVTALNFGTSFTTSPHSALRIGVTNAYNYHATETSNSIMSQSGDYVIYLTDGRKINNGTYTSYGSEIQKLDILQIALDLDNNKIWFGNNGTWFASGNPTTGANPAFSNLEAGDYAFGINDWNRTSHAGKFAVNFGQDSSFAGNKTSQGNQDSGGIGDFYYTPPSGFKALCTKNLPAVAVTPSEHFNTITYTGTGNTNNPQTVGFQPDLVWFKSRSASRAHVLVDAVRGVTKELVSNSTGAEQTSSATQDLTAFTSTGFTLGTPYNNSANESGASIVAWNWKANGSGSSNTDGSVTSTVSANVDAGFSIVGWNANMGEDTIGHGLSKAPELVIVKNRTDADRNWVTLNTTGTDKSGYINSTNAMDTGNLPYFFGDNSTYTAPTATVFTVGNNEQVNGSSDNIIAYCFHSVDGYSKVGSYTGNGNADGTFVYTGFRPAFLLMKVTNTASDWHIVDSARDVDNVIQKTLDPNTSSAEGSGSNRFDFTSNGFKLRQTSGSYNGNGSTYIYLAFAETPFKYSNAR